MWRSTMFWKFDLHTTSHIDTLLDKEDVTLTEVMDEEDVLQECKAQNHKLVDFLVRPQCMEHLVRFITQEPSQDMEEKIKYKYPNISCELLTSDVGQINDRLGEDDALLLKLYGFLQSEPPLNPLLASFFSKVLSILIGRKPEQIVEFLRRREDFVDVMIKHIGTSAIMDLLLRMLTCIEPQQLRQDVLNWLNEEKVIQRLVDMVQPSQDEDRHSNASQSLCEIIRLSRDQMFQVQGSSEPDPLLATLEKQETVEQLLSNIFDKEKNESAIVSVIQILLTLFETRRPAFEGHLELCPPGLNHPSFSVNQSILEAVRPRLKDFHQLLLEPPKKAPLKTTWGVLDPPVGNTRLNVVRLVATLLQTGTHVINQELINLNILGVILDMYFKYIWNNFLHIQVEICTAMILAMPPTQSDTDINRDDDKEPVRENILITHLFQKCRLIQRILEAWSSNEKEQMEGGRRRGYMGHLTRIANSIVHNSDKGPNGTQIQQLLSELQEDERDRWEAFTSGQLADTNKKNTVDLVNTHHIHSSSDDEVDFKDSGFHHDSSLQQFGFNDEEFADQDDVVDIPFDRISDINFSLNTNESANMALFEACCKEKIQQFEDAGSDEEDIWDEKDVTFPQDVQRRPRSAGSTDSEESTDSEDEEVKRDTFEAVNTTNDDRMEVDSGEGPVWTANFDDIPMDTGGVSAPPLSSPGSLTEPATWNSPTNTVATETGWADFSSFTPVSPKDPLRSNSPVAMETSAETMDPLGVNAPAGAEQWPADEPAHTPVSPGAKSGGGSDTEEEPVGDRVTETVTNGSMKETLSLTVDAKTETAVFKSEEEKRSTSEDSSAQYVVGDGGESDRPLSAPPTSSCQKSGAKHLEENTKAVCEALNGPLDNAAPMDEAKIEQQVPSPDTVVNGPV
ncbi:serine/threonine-protein phosphatase 6 regulatory subunit 3 isoform X2 [Brachyhypopomus gauderio]|uniref:serine/threonine-protein phosphatase 6 regulatory subunit 3 isoform X2 n=1 Tax=Brachyhypopomus gauderio TaxID=698409 RepID=UPI0040436ED2